MKFFLPLLLVTVILASCSHVYTPALYHQDIVYQPKPASFDKESAASYVSAGFNYYSNPNLSDGVASGQLELSRGYRFNGFNLSYGGFGVLGDYSNGSIDKGQPDYFTDKFFGAVGGRASANLFVTSGRADIRFIGIEAAYSHEFGDYATLRQSLQSQPNFYVDPRTNLFSIGLTSEVIFHDRNNDDFEHGIRGFLGTTLGHDDLDDTYYTDNSGQFHVFHHLYPKASYFIKLKNYFGSIEAGSGFFIRVGVKF